MPSEAFQLAILLTLKDAASGGLDRFEARLRAAGKEGEHFAKDLEHIRSGLSRDLAVGGIGLGGLKMLKDGVQTAADYQTVMTDLRATFALTGKDGHVNLNQLAQDMAGAEALAVRLGNSLPGTTADFAEELQILKQNGLDVATVLGGAGEAFAHLAVANNALPKDVAAYGAEFGNLFKLKQDEFKPAANVMSKIFTSHGQTAEELIEAAKYFQGRAGSSLGISGLKSAEEFTQLFGLMGMKGMRGSMGGTMLTDFFDEYVKNKKKLGDMTKATGIKLDFFDKAGKFVGLDSVFEQMKQFDKLSDKDRSTWMTKVFGIRGMTAGNVFAQEGLEGWKSFKDQQAQVIEMEDKVAMKSATFNNQLKNLKTTLTNLKVAAFGPMLPGLTAAASKANDLVAVLQVFTKDHPDLAKYAVEFLAIGAATMAAYSGIKALTTGVQLYKLASTFARGGGLAGHLNETSAATATVTRNVTQLTEKEAAIQQLGGTIVATTDKTKGLANGIAVADKQAGSLRKNLFSLNNVFKAVFVLEAIGFTWDQISELRKTVDQWKAMNSGLDQTGKMNYSVYQGTPTEQRDPKREAADALALLQAGNQEFAKALDPSKQSWTDWYARGIGSLVGKDTNFQLYQGRQTTSQVLSNPESYKRVQQVDRMPFREGLVEGTFANSIERVASEMAAVRNLQQRAPALQDPAVMSSFRKDVMPTLGLSDVKKQFLDQLLQQAFPQSFSQSLTGMFQGAANNLTQSFSSLQQPMAGTAELFSGLPQPMNEATGAFRDILPPMADTNRSFGDLSNSARPLPGAFNNVFVSANNLSSSLDAVSLKLSNWQPPAASPVPTPTPTAPAPGGAVSIYKIPTTYDKPDLRFPFPLGSPADSAAITTASNAVVHRTTIGPPPAPIRSPLPAFAFGASQTPNPRYSPLRAISDAAGRDGNNSRIDPSLLRAAEQSPRSEISQGSQAISFTYSPQVTINGDSPTAKEDFRAMLNDHSKEIERIVAKSMTDGRVRA